MQLNKSELGKDSSYRKRLLLIVLADIVCIAWVCQEKCVFNIL